MEGKCTWHISGMSSEFDNGAHKDLTKKKKKKKKKKPNRQKYQKLGERF
jgi:hypothetical protein